MTYEVQGFFSIRRSTRVASRLYRQAYFPFHPYRKRVYTEYDSSPPYPSLNMDPCRTFTRVGNRIRFPTSQKANHPNGSHLCLSIKVLSLKHSESMILFSTFHPRMFGSLICISATVNYFHSPLPLYVWLDSLGSLPALHPEGWLF